MCLIIGEKRSMQSVMPKTPVVIALLPSGLRAATIAAGGEVIRSNRIAFPPGFFDTVWTDGFRVLDQPLRELIASLGITQGTRVTLSYVGSKLLADAFASPARGTTALHAGTLALRETISGKAEGWTMRVCPWIENPANLRDQLKVASQLAVDQTDTATASQFTGEARVIASHIFASAEQQATIDAIGMWLRRSGLVPVAIVPSKLAVMDAALQAALAASQRHSGTSVLPVLYLGEHAMVLIGVTQQRVEFVRAIDIGYSLLVEAMIRGATASGVVLPNLEHASKLLFACGIPKRGDMLDPSITFRADAFLPLMQAVVQRFCVETRQTLRFTIPESELHRVSIVLTGPGARIRGLDNVLTSHLDMPVDVGDKSLQTSDVEEPLGDMADLLRMRSRFTPFLPQCEQHARGNRRARVATLCGGALGLSAVLFGIFGSNQSRATVDRIETEQLPKVVELQEQAASSIEADTLALDLSRVAAEINEDLGMRPAWASKLRALSFASGEHIAILEILGGYSNEQAKSAVITIRGMASTNPASITDDQLSAFINRLAVLPGVASARLTSTRVLRDGSNVERTQFVIALALQTTPPLIDGVGVAVEIATESAALDESPAGGR